MNNAIKKHLFNNNIKFLTPIDGSVITITIAGVGEFGGE